MEPGSFFCEKKPGCKATECTQSIFVFGDAVVTVTVFLIQRSYWVTTHFDDAMFITLCDNLAAMRFHAPNTPY